MRCYARAPAKRRPRGFLFVVDGPEGRFSWFFQNSVSTVDLTVQIVVGGKNYGAPLDNVKAALKDAGLDSVDLWIGIGGRSVAEMQGTRFLYPDHQRAAGEPQRKSRVRREREKLISQIFQKRRTNSSA